MSEASWGLVLWGPAEVPEDEYPPEEPVKEAVLQLQCRVREHRQHPPLGFTAPIAHPVHIVRFDWTDYTGQNWSAQWFVHDQMIESVRVPFLVRRVDIADKGVVELGLDQDRQWQLLVQYEGFWQGQSWKVPPLPDPASRPVRLEPGT